ncbi:MAG: hypothetical protein JSR39_05530 [Verrucomicrobia bacterium]|nr:hypothetical protein [Verrucomicrobiota bacterium]
MSHNLTLVAPIAFRAATPSPEFFDFNGAENHYFSEEIQRILSPVSEKEEDLSSDLKELELERRSITPTRHLDNDDGFDETENSDAFGSRPVLQEKVQQLADSIFYTPPFEEVSGDVIFVEFWERRGAFNYEEVHESCLDLHIAPFQVAVTSQKFFRSVTVKEEQTDGTIELKRSYVPTPFLHEPARAFLKKNLTDLEDALAAIRQNQVNSDYQFTQMFNTVAVSINRVAQSSLDASGREVLLKEKKTLQALGKQVRKVINSNDCGLLVQHETIQRRHEGFQMFVHAMKELQSGKDKPVLCPSLFRNETFKFTRLPSDFPDLPAKVLAQFYDEYENLLVAHRAYFTQAISAHHKLNNAANDLIKEIDIKLSLC